MNNEELIRKLIKGSIQRAIQESVAVVLVLVAFATILASSEIGSPRYYGCLIILVGAGFIDCCDVRRKDEKTCEKNEEKDSWFHDQSPH